MLSDRIRAMGGLHWLSLFGLILGAWLILYVMAIPREIRDGARIFGADFIASFCIVTPDMGGFVRMVAMWGLMSAAMMAPTALPAFATYDELSHAGARLAPLVAGYLGVWLGFSVFAAGLQMVLFQAELVSDFGDSRSVALSAALLLLAGLYQLSPAKEACLSKCRAPLVFFLQYFEEGPWRNGLRLGLVCLGCCWALMLLAFVGGVMNLAFMGLATVIMVLEKLPEIGRWLTKPLGVALIAAAGWMVV